MIVGLAALLATIEPLLLLEPFAKAPLNIVFNGITNDDTDISVLILWEVVC